MKNSINVLHRYSLIKQSTIIKLTVLLELILVFCLMYVPKADGIHIRQTKSVHITSSINTSIAMVATSVG